MLHAKTLIFWRFHFPASNCFDIVLEEPTEWYLFVEVLVFLVNP